MVTAIFEKGERSKTVRGLWQYDYGQVLRIQGLSLPNQVQVHFALQETGGEAFVRLGVTQDGVTDVTIPDSILQKGDTAYNYTVYAFIYRTDETCGRTEYRIKMPVTARPRPEGLTEEDEVSGGTMKMLLDIAQQNVEGKQDDLNILPISRITEYGVQYRHVESLNTSAIYLTADVDTGEIVFKNDKGNISIQIRFKDYMVCTFSFASQDMLSISNADSMISVYTNRGYARITYDDSGDMTGYEARAYAYRDEILTKTNITEYTPTKDYHPATKKYVDDNRAKTAYEYAKEGGYDGTQEEFAAKLAEEPYTLPMAGVDKLGGVMASAWDPEVYTKEVRISPAGYLQTYPDVPKIRYMQDLYKHVQSAAAVVAEKGTSDIDIAYPAFVMFGSNSGPSFPFMVFAYDGRIYNGSLHAGNGTFYPLTEIGSNYKIGRIEMTSADITAELQPNTLYVFPEMESLSLTFAAPTDTTIANEYHCIFKSGATATTLTLPDTVKIPDSFSVETNKIYEISVLENCLSYMSWDYTTEVTT